MWEGEGEAKMSVTPTVEKAVFEGAVITERSAIRGGRRYGLQTNKQVKKTKRGGEEAQGRR